MKQLLFMALVPFVLAACTHAEPESQSEQESVDVIFEVRPDGWSVAVEPIDHAASTRALDADGKSMTDIWVLDYVGGALQQQVHQQSTDDGFGSVAMTLPVGPHDLYFVASRGSGAQLDTDTHTITFAKVSDTFYKALPLNVSATTKGAQAVSLDRCVTKLRLTFTDAIPSEAARFEVTPSAWYYGIDYQTGLPTAPTASQMIPITIPSTAIGSAGESLSIFGFSGTDEWTADISLCCKATDSSVLGTATISGAKFRRNRVSAYTGPLFNASGAMTLVLNADWDTELSGTW